MSNNKKTWFQTILTAVIIGGLSTVILLYTSGYRINKGEETDIIDLKKTGMVSAKSIPVGATVYLNDKLITATNDTLSGVEPGKHNLRIVKKGYEKWEKEIEVFEELVTDITAVLVSQSPMLEPLTNTGAKNPSLSPTGTKLAYFSNDTENPGVWIVPINQGGLNIFRATPYIVLKDTRLNIFSDGKSIEWSPDEKQLIVTTNDDYTYLVNLDSNTSQSMTNAEDVRLEWQNKQIKRRSDFMTKIEIPADFRELATSPEVMWSPDEKKFLFKKIEGDKIQYRVYNMEKPLPVGETVESLVFETNLNEIQPEITWYADSFHLILTEGDINEENKLAKVYLIRIDGTNKIEIYGQTLHSKKVFSVPTGDKIIILTSFKSEDQTDLYTVSIR